jgi:thiosulfate dehydrogenase [quinone] large subunit
MSSQGFLKGIFQWLASDSLVGIVDALNIVVLVGVGLTLILGIWTRWASIAGFLILILYYFSHPSFPGLPEGPSEGSYWIINKNLIEAVALWVLFQFPTSKYFGLEIFLKRKKSLEQAVN